MKERLLAVVGPTGSGKTALSIELALKFNGEIICADSRTIYKGLDIGTAKPEEDERRGIPHYGLDIIDPSQGFSAAQFQVLARGWIKEIRAKGKLPIIVGGTGLYVDGLIYDFQFGPPANEGERLIYQSLSVTELQSEIVGRGIDMPENLLNKRYLIRALEQGGLNHAHSSSAPGTVIIGLDPGKDILESRLKKRLDAMIQKGVIDEAKNLFNEYGYNCPGASGNIYRALAPYFKQGVDIEVCFQEFLKLDKKLAKRQRTWFKRNKDIHWFGNPSEAVQFLSSEF